VIRRYPKRKTRAHTMNRNVALWLAIAIVIVAAYAIYRSSHSTGRLNVEPHAAEEIEKAKRR